MATKKVVKDASEVKSIADINKELAAKRHDLLEAQKGLKSGELANPRVISALRKDIARLLTQMRAQSSKEEQ